MGKPAFLPPSPFERGLQLLQEPSCLEGLEDSVFMGLWSELAGPGTEKDRSSQIILEAATCILHVKIQFSVPV